MVKASPLRDCAQILVQHCRGSCRTKNRGTRRARAAEAAVHSRQDSKLLQTLCSKQFHNSSQRPRSQLQQCTRTTTYFLTVTLIWGNPCTFARALTCVSDNRVQWAAGGARGDEPGQGEWAGTFQNALLSLAASHAHFGHTTQALTALNETVGFVQGALIC